MLAIALVSLFGVALLFLYCLLYFAFGGPERAERKRRTTDIPDGWWRDVEPGRVVTSYTFPDGGRILQPGESVTLVWDRDGLRPMDDDQ